MNNKSIMPTLSAKLFDTYQVSETIYIEAKDSKVPLFANDFFEMLSAFTPPILYQSLKEISFSTLLKVYTTPAVFMIPLLINKVATGKLASSEFSTTNALMDKVKELCHVHNSILDNYVFSWLLCKAAPVCAVYDALTHCAAIGFKISLISIRLFAVAILTMAGATLGFLDVYVLPIHFGKNMIYNIVNITKISAISFASFINSWYGFQWIGALWLSGAKLMMKLFTLASEVNRKYPEINMKDVYRHAEQLQVALCNIPLSLLLNLAGPPMFVVEHLRRATPKPQPMKLTNWQKIKNFKNNTLADLKPIMKVSYNIFKYLKEHHKGKILTVGFICLWTSKYPDGLLDKMIWPVVKVWHTVLDLTTSRRTTHAMEHISQEISVLVKHIRENDQIPDLIQRIEVLEKLVESQHQFGCFKTSPEALY